jgi:hypothetical protein
VSRVLPASGPTRTGRPPEAVMDLVHQLEAEATKGQLGGTSATVNVLLDRYREHLERKALCPKTLHTYRKCIDTRSGQLSGAVRSSDSRRGIWTLSTPR